MSKQPERNESSSGAGRWDDQEVQALVRRAKAGDMGAFDDLVRTFQSPMYNLAYRMVGNREDADDVTQEIFVKMYRAIDKFRGDSKFSTWLYALATNMCRSKLRKIRRIGAFEVVHLDETTDTDDGERARPEPVDKADKPDKMLERRELRRMVESAMTALPDEFKAVIVLRDLQGLSYEEIADALRCSIGTVKSRLARARDRVKKALHREGLTCAAQA